MGGVFHSLQYDVVEDPDSGSQTELGVNTAHWLHHRFRDLGELLTYLSFNFLINKIRVKNFNPQGCCKD